MNHTSRRLAAAVLALGLTGSLSACGQDNPFGRIVRGEDPNATSTPAATTTQTDEPTGFGLPTAEDTMSESPSESATTLADPASPATTAPETSTSSTSPAATPGTTTSTVTTAAETTTAQVDGRTIAGVPSGLGFPPSVQLDGTSSFEKGGGSVVMSAPAEDDIFAFYRSALPNGGFRVVSDTAGTLTFTGRGFRGSLVGTGEGGVLTWTPVAP